MTDTTAFWIDRLPTASFRRWLRLATAGLMVALTGPSAATAQVTTGAPLPTSPRPAMTEPRRALYDAAELDRIVSPIALYPDPLLAQLLNAATFPREVPLAAQWVDRRRNMSGEQLTDALANDRVSWDPSVQALVAFPSVLQMMASAMPWTEEVGDAFLTQHADVMDAVQRMREQAQRYGYLRSNNQWQVTASPVIEILPVNPAYVVVPYYDPYIVFAPPRPRFVVSTAIYFGYGVRLGVWYEPWGWRQSGFDWATRRVVYGYPGWDRPRDYRYVNVRSYRFEGQRDARNDRGNDSRNDPRRVGRADPEPFRYAVPRGTETRRDDNNGRAVNGDNGSNGGYRSGNTGNARDTERDLRRDAPREVPRETPRDIGRGTPRDADRSTPRSTPREAPRAAPQDTPRDARRGGGRDVEPVQVQAQPRGGSPRGPEPRPSEPRQSEPRASEGRTAQPRGGREFPRSAPPAERSAASDGARRRG